LLLVALAGLSVHSSRHKNWLLVIGFGVLVHLVLDQIWLDTQTLFWPIQGFSFPSVYRTGWEQGQLHGLLTSPKEYVPELVGMAILACFAWLLIHRGGVYTFIRHGQV